MKNYAVTQGKTLELFSLPPSSPEQGFAKVRITKAGISYTDLLVYQGEASLPLVPGRQGTGVISEIAEDNIYGLKKGDRVLINPYLPCNNCFYCKTEQPSRCDNMKIMGLSADGLLTDFKNIPISNLMHLPKQVNDEDALFSEYISLALDVLDTLNIEKGDQVAIVGGNTLGNILAQLTIYYQAIPILIDNNAKNLEKAESTGIYYTISGDGDVNSFLSQITGGRLAKYVIYVSGVKKSINNALSYCSNGGIIAVTGFAASSMNADIGMALNNQLKIFTFNNGYNQMSSAINMLATGAVNVQGLITSKIKFNEIAECFLKNGSTITSDQLFQAVADCLTE